MDEKRLLLVVNPVAGRIKISEAFFDIVKVFSDAGYAVKVHMTKARGEAAELTERFGPTSDLVVLCGGDGTLNEGVSGLLRAGCDTPIGYIPCGTTNDFAAGLGLERENMKLAAERIVSGRAEPIDVGRFGEVRFFNYIASFGAFTDTSYSVSQATKNAWGHLAYVLEGLKTLPYIKPIHARVATFEGDELEDDYIFAAVTNATSIGGVVKINSDKVDFSDGEFELMLVRNPRTALEISRLILAVQTGKYEDSCISFYHTKGAIFDMDESIPWALDGEYGNGGRRVEIKVLEKAIRIMV